MIMNILSVFQKGGCVVIALKWLLLLLFLAFAVVVICNVIVNRAAKGRCYTDLSALPHRSDALVLGTNPLAKSGRPNSFFKNRIKAAADMYFAGKCDRIILSGAKTGNDYDEPQTMHDDLLALGVPDSVMVLDGEGFRTIHSMKRACGEFGADSLIIVSQEFHNIRAIYQAKHLGIDAIGFNAEDSPYRYWRIKNHLREYLARVKVVLEMTFGKYE